MKWQELTIHTTEEAVEMISNFLHELDADGVSIEESGTLNKERDTSFGQWYEHALNDIPEGQAVIKGYFNSSVDMEHMIAELQPRVNQLTEFDIHIGDVQYEVNEVDDEDWAHAWKQYFKPVEVTPTLVIKPSWEQYDAKPTQKVIEIDPGMAFGTGTHATTTLCLKALEQVIKGGEHVIDVGTGSGILAVGACKLGADRVLALDLDPVAVSSAMENASLNQLSDQIDVQLSDLLGVITQENNDTAQSLAISLPVDIVVANILAEVILLFVEDVFAALKPGGIYIASGIYKDKAELVEQGLVKHGFVIMERKKEEDWTAIIAQKPQVNI
ncbi:50S ribosomal protein L11 methyltransferase [Paenibacillus yanchengensis]|uniref:Ribosomal protein L11 methyltransferase n=1 Tax=Paenibacillus yanchengensis TaxID=2035833 RepID=A0ABW4YKH2_9BACL